MKGCIYAKFYRASRCAKALMADNLRNLRVLFVVGDRTYMRSVMAKLLLIDSALLVKIEVLEHFLAF
jgi:hypothetical protein